MSESGRPPIVYESLVGGRPRRLLFLDVRTALFHVVSDRHHGHATPIALHRGGKLLADRAKLERVYQACREDLEREPFKMPGALQALAP
jgi:hypothetical protein